MSDYHEMFRNIFGDIKPRATATQSDVRNTMIDRTAELGGDYPIGTTPTGMPRYANDECLDCHCTYGTGFCSHEQP